MIHNHKQLKVFDLYKKGKGLFEYMNDIQALPFEEVLDIKTIDLSFITFYGNRDISSPIEHIVGEEVTDENMKQIASMLYGLYYQKWSNLYEIYKEEVDLDSYVLITDENIQDDGTEESTVTSSNDDTSTHSVTGYNSDEFVDSEQDTNKGTGNTQNEGKNNNLRDRHQEQRGNLGNRLDDRQKAIDGLNQDVIQEVVFKDTVQLVGSLMF